MYDEIYEILSNVDTIITSNTEEKEKESMEKVKKYVYDLASGSRITTTNTTAFLQMTLR